MYDLCKGSTRVKLEYDPLKVNRKIRNCAKYAHRASQSAKSAAAEAAAAEAAAAKLEPYWLMSLTWQYMSSRLQFLSLLEWRNAVSSDKSVNAGRECAWQVAFAWGWVRRESLGLSSIGVPRTSSAKCSATEEASECRRAAAYLS